MPCRPTQSTLLFSLTGPRIGKVLKKKQKPNQDSEAQIQIELVLLSLDIKKKNNVTTQNTTL